jgi:twitching motility protein PilT
MTHFREEIQKIKLPKAKCELLQKLLGTLNEDSLEDYRVLVDAYQGTFGKEIRGYAKKCLQFADKKHPSLRKKLEEEKKAEVERQIHSTEDLPEERKCPMCQMSIPFTALTCHHCGASTKVEAPREVANTYPVTAVDMMKKANSLGASDIHCSVDYHPIFRISGTMIHQKDLPLLKAEDTLSIAYQMLDNETKRIFESQKEVDQAFDIPGICRLRLNVAEERRGPAIVARILPSSILSMDDLRFENKEVFIKLCQEVNGLILVTGPTGSGKSTTLAAMLDYINKFREEHMITIEDPIEFVHEPKKSKIMQRELRTNTLSFHNALKSALRQDPDIMLVGELRDQETTALALEAAETGHLVFGTLHTNSAAKTVDRVINMFPAEDQAKIRVNLAENLKGIIAQQLIKKVGGGRVAVQEIMLRSNAISALIRDGRTFQINEYIGTAKNKGMQLMDDCIQKNLARGDISKENAYRYALNKTNFVYSEEQKDDFVEGEETESE